MRRMARLLAQARAFKLDRALAGDTRPDASPSLCLRAHALISAIHRRQLARELRRVTCDAQRSRHPFDCTVSVPREVLLVSDGIEEIIEVLEGPGAIDARGVAHLEILLRDGAGPLYGKTAATRLRQALQEIIHALVRSPVDEADA